MSSVFEDKLFKEQEGPLVRNLLSDLNKRFPGIFSSKPCAVRTLCVLDEELDLEDLFKDRSSQDLRECRVKPRNRNIACNYIPPSGWS